MDKEEVILPCAEIVEKPNSCEIAVNAKGEISFKVKAYAASLDVAVEECYKSFIETKQRLSQK